MILIALLLSIVLQAADRPMQVEPWPREPENPSWQKPADAPEAVKALLGEYGPEADAIYVFERGGTLWAVKGHGTAAPIDRKAFVLDDKGRGARVNYDGAIYLRRQVGPADGGQLKVKPLRPVADVIKDALKDTPPKETGEFRNSELVELVKLDPTIKLEIRYATTNNFLGSQFYSEARAFMQRPAAEAVVRASRTLQAQGYGLLIHDGYRPWYVTKTFWDATPDDKKWLVADPKSGSRHNRGCAVDLTLYDLKTGKTIEMPSTYDESTDRAYAWYPGGTELQHWHRALLRRAMEAEGFSVNPNEWWHFDYKDSRFYRIGNVKFAEIK